MPRKGPAPRRPLTRPGLRVSVVTQLINKVLLDGKTVAESIVYGALKGVRDKTSQDPVVVLKRALDNVRPALEVRCAPGRRRHVPGAGRGAPRRWPCAG